MTPPKPLNPVLTWIARYVRPRAIAAGVEDVPPRQLAQRGIRGVILDLDNTLVPWNTTRISPAVRGWLDQARLEGLKLCIISNSAGDRRVEFVGRTLGIPFVSKAVKPSRRAFRLALAQMELEPDQVAVVGDQLFTDVLGGNRLGLFTILVTPVTRRDFIATKGMRLLERIIRTLLKSIPVEQEEFLPPSTCGRIATGDHE